MRILHYSLGFPPFRTGGLTKYCVDLMFSQRDRGHDVTLVWPGSMAGKFYFRYRGSYKGVGSVEMRDPLPIPYDEGVVNPSLFRESRSYKTCRAFLMRCRPDVLHVHSTMGLPAELIEAARDLCVRTVFTTHDYYPLCPRVTMFNNGAPCTAFSECNLCPACNANGLSYKKMQLLQSSLYRLLKDFAPVKMVRARHRVAAGSLAKPVTTAFQADASEYRALKNRNIDLLELFDVIHANSSLAAGYYRRALPYSKIQIIPIANAESDAKFSAAKRGGEDVIRFGYMGPANVAKGFYLLIEALDLLWDKGRRFELDLYGPIVCDRPYVRIHPRFANKEIDSVYEAIDLALVPSIWPETFGFPVVEAMSRGIPVAVSNMVGARDLIEPGMGIVFNPTVSSCADALDACFEEGYLEKMHDLILGQFKPPQLEDVEILYEGNSF